uniref:Uncharacterized protein n=2 Tax=Kalanchoe fedtschenkoi TaxID=63787 RepID=A0A7N0RA06_KALFE
MSDSRNRGNERFYSPPAVRRHQRNLTMQREQREQRERELMIMRQQQQQQYLQQQQQYLHQQQQQQLQQTTMMRMQFDEEQRQKRLIHQQRAQLREQQVAARRETQVQSAPAEADDSRSEVAESTLSGNSSTIQTNIDRLVETVTPRVPARYLPQPRRNGQEVPEANMVRVYYLNDLWESFREWSAYGAGVELTLSRKDKVTQYYVPSLSIIQLYVDPANARKPGIDSISQRMSRISMASSPSTGESSQSSRKLIFEYQEHELPHQRQPLFDKISALATGFADLKKYRSCDLLPSSWMSVAWYPIYRIPTGPSLKNLEASFLTFHHLSTPPTSVKSIIVGASGSSKMALPVFGLASYKLSSPILPLQDSEQRLAESLFESARDWIERHHVYHPDFNFFLRNGRCPESNPGQSKKA